MTYSKQWFEWSARHTTPPFCIFRGKRRVKKSLAEARIRVERRLYKKKYVAATPSRFATTPSETVSWLQ